MARYNIVNNRNFITIAIGDVYFAVIYSKRIWFLKSGIFAIENKAVTNATTVIDAPQNAVDYAIQYFKDNIANNVIAKYKIYCYDTIYKAKVYADGLIVFTYQWKCGIMNHYMISSGNRYFHQTSKNKIYFEFHNYHPDMFCRKYDIGESPSVEELCNQIYRDAQYDITQYYPYHNTKK